MVQQGGSMKELIGKKIKGFKFDNANDLPYINKLMNNYIGKVGVITEVFDECVTVIFDGIKWFYPLPEALNHIVEEHPKRGNEVLVWDRYESTAVKRIFLAYIEGAEYPIQVVLNGYEENFKNGETFATSKYRNYKTIPQKTKAAELIQIFGKELALIAVDEILKVAFFASDEIYNHYLEVKQEIENYE
jgi:hypothetical protein